MSEDVDRNDAETEPSAAEDPGQLGELMQPGGDAPPADDPLEAKALAAAAELAIQEGERALATAAAALRGADAAPETGTAASAPPRNVWLLRGLLVINLAMMGVMFGLPPATGEQPRVDSTQQTTPADPVPERPFVQEPRKPSLGLPKDEIYTQALLVAAQGNFAEAVTLLQAYLSAHPDLPDHITALVCGHIAYYLNKDGRAAEALEYELRYARLANSNSLPENLWRMAIEAEKRGDGREMRRAYARLLLQQNMIPPTLKSAVTEAYLKLGDSYRIEAELGSDEADAADQRRLERLRELRGWEPSNEPYQKREKPTEGKKH